MDDAAPAPENEQRPSGNRWQTIWFVTVFVVSILVCLTGYRYVIHTYANDWYLFQVAKNTNSVLDLVGYQSQLEGGMIQAESPRQARASLAAWAQDREPTQEEIDAASPNALSAWESWRYRAESVRRSGRSQAMGPRVAFILKSGTSTRLIEIEQELRQLRLQRMGSQAEVANETRALEAERDALRDILNRSRTVEGEVDPDPSYVFHFIVVPECGAIEVMAIFLSAVLAFPTRARKKLLGLLLGLPLMYLVNIFRLSCLAIIGALDGGGEWFNFAHHYVWQAIYIVFVVGVWLAWVEYVVRRKPS